MIVVILLLIAAILLFGRGTVLLVIIATGLWGLANFAHAETTYSYTKADKIVMCPSAAMTAQLESLSQKERFSARWQHIGGHAYCVTVKSDFALIVTKSGEISFRGRNVPIVEVVPAGVHMTMPGFGGPFYMLATRLKHLPNAEQIEANVAAFLPTVVHYTTDGM